MMYHHISVYDLRGRKYFVGKAGDNHFVVIGCPLMVTPDDANTAIRLLEKNHITNYNDTILFTEDLPW